MDGWLVERLQREESYIYSQENKIFVDFVILNLGSYSVNGVLWRRYTHWSRNKDGTRGVQGQQ